MPSLTAKDRVSLCLFTFTDGRRCRTPRTGNHPHFCFYHSQKEAQARAAESLAKDLANFFSGDYLSACDLSTALARLIPAVIRGDIKPRLARTVAYMFQTQLQAIHLSQHEYINAFGTDGWRKAVRTSVNVNYDYRFPPDPDAAEPKPEQAAPPPPQESEDQEQAPALQAPTPRTPTSSPHANSPANRSAVANTQPPRSNSVPTQPVGPTASPSTHITQSPSFATQPSAPDTAPSAARSLFRRRPNSASDNPFRTNIYTPSRNC
jgi:hypothetical protein